MHPNCTLQLATLLQHAEFWGRTIFSPDHLKYLGSQVLSHPSQLTANSPSLYLFHSRIETSLTGMSTRVQQKHIQPIEMNFVFP